MVTRAWELLSVTFVIDVRTFLFFVSGWDPWLQTLAHPSRTKIQVGGLLHSGLVYPSSSPFPRGCEETFFTYPMHFKLVPNKQPGIYFFTQVKYLIKDSTERTVKPSTQRYSNPRPIDPVVWALLTRYSKITWSFAFSQLLESSKKLLSNWLKMSFCQQVAETLVRDEAVRSTGDQRPPPETGWNPKPCS